MPKKKKIHYYKENEMTRFSVLPVPKWLMPKMNEVYLEFVKYGMERGLRTSKRDWQFLQNMFTFYIYSEKLEKFQEYIKTSLEFSQKLEEELKNK